jgi:hypothetical protein
MQEYKFPIYVCSRHTVVSIRGIPLASICPPLIPDLFVKLTV